MCWIFHVKALVEKNLLKSFLIWFHHFQIISRTFIHSHLWFNHKCKFLTSCLSNILRKSRKKSYKIMRRRNWYVYLCFECWKFHENRVKNYLARFIFVTCSLIEICWKTLKMSRRFKIKVVWLFINAYSRNNCMNAGENRGEEGGMKTLLTITTYFSSITCTFWRKFLFASDHFTIYLI